MGAPVGNKNAAKGRQWKAAIERALAKRTELMRVEGEAQGSPALAAREALDEVAAALIEGALLGDLPAIKELGDRLDGKPTQTLASDADNPIGFVLSVDLS